MDQVKGEFIRNLTGNQNKVELLLISTKFLISQIEADQTHWDVFQCKNSMVDRHISDNYFRQFDIHRHNKHYTELDIVCRDYHVDLDMLHCQSVLTTHKA
jgi:hypothetical protein